MAKYLYEIQTGFPRNFDPDVRGVTLDSIIETCEGVINYCVPLNVKETVIIVQMSSPITKEREDYLRRQLESEFGNDYFILRQAPEGEWISSVGFRNVEGQDL